MTKEQKKVALAAAIKTAREQMPTIEMYEMLGKMVLAITRDEERVRGRK